MSKTALCQVLMTTLERPLTLNSGKVLPAGTEVVLLPQTTAHSVLVSADQTLAEAWDGLSKVGHVHEDDQANLVHYASELTRYADRLAAIETWEVANGFTPPTQGA